MARFRGKNSRAACNGSTAAAAAAVVAEAVAVAAVGQAVAIGHHAHRSTWHPESSGFLRGASGLETPAMA